MSQQEPEIPTMLFEDALGLVKIGSPCRRKAWNRETRQKLILINGALFFQFHNNAHHYEPALRSEDLLAEDWLEYTEPT